MGFSAAAAIVCMSGYVYFVKSNTLMHSRSTGRPSGNLALHAIKLTPRHITLHKTLPGRVVAFKTAEIRPQVNGIIMKRLFKEGSSVQEGQQLYQIDPALYEAAYRSARADLQKAEANHNAVLIKYRRFERLLKTNAVSEQDYDDVKANLDLAAADVAIAKAAVSEAKVNLDYTKCYAPISGEIGKSSVNEGDLVTANQSDSLVTISQLDPIYVDMTIASDALTNLRQDPKSFDAIPITLLLSEIPNPYPLKGKLMFHEVTVDESTGSVQLRAQFSNPKQLLLPGLFVRAQLEIELEDALLIPQEATQRNPDGALLVWLVNQNDQSISQHPVKAQEALGNNWVLEEGLNANDVIITEGLMRLRPGMTVEPLFEGVTNNDGEK